MPEQKQFIHCEKCGKRLIARKPDGSGEFIFGKKSGSSGKSPVRIKIWGLVEICCLNRECPEITHMSFFPGKGIIDNRKKQSDAMLFEHPASFNR